MEPSQSSSDDQPAADGSSGDRAITILGSPKLGQIGGAEPGGAGRSESNEDDPAPQALQVIPPADQCEKPPSKSKPLRSGLQKPSRADRVITYNYLPPRRPEPPRVEILVPGDEEVKDVLHYWEPFHCRASAAYRLNSLYPTMYRVPVTAWGTGIQEDYSVPVPASTSKEDFPQIIDDGIQVRNRNFVQSTELVR